MFGKNKAEQNKTLLKEDNYGSIEFSVVDFILNPYAENVDVEETKQWGRRFEDFLEELFKMSGFEVERTSRGVQKADGGIDMYLKKDGVTYAVQAKKRGLFAQDLIGKSDVGSFVASLKDGEKGVFITTHFFSVPAMDVAKEKNIELLDKEGLLRLIAQLQPQLLAKAIMCEWQDVLGFCPECGAPKTRGFKAGLYEQCLNARNRQGCTAKARKVAVADSSKE